jgi:hypothetical protein
MNRKTVKPAILANPYRTDADFKIESYYSSVLIKNSAQSNLDLIIFLDFFCIFCVKTY